MDRNEYIVNLTNNMIESFKKETTIEKQNADNDVLFEYFSSIFEVIVKDPH